MPLMIDAKERVFMKISKSVRKAIDEWNAGDFESAMTHACNALDGTASKVFPNHGSAAGFTRLIRQHYAILVSMALPIPDIANYRFNVRLENPKAPGGRPDAADVIYGIHRCCHNHGKDLPDGFELISEVAGPLGTTKMFHELASGKVRFSDRLIFGLLSIVVYSPVNTHQKDPELDGYCLTYGAREFLINEWWGRMDEIKVIVESEGPHMLVIEEYGD